ncbi:glycoside hydrolase family 2 protein [Patulibacter minatonensis]|uniref:glycoside hydrolase family 2 protein n=1 Tax=Patulibacter minatonensis TaxID=298163 RepID=UPI0004B96C51|nr:hypothetical protein [Patulibacter minatonensis]
MPDGDPEPAGTAVGPVPADGDPLADGWSVASCAPGAHEDPTTIDALDWVPAAVPGTAASALIAAGRLAPGETLDTDAHDWWYRTTFPWGPEDGEEAQLELDGLATVADVFLNGEQVASSTSMFVGATAFVTDAVRPENELAIRFRSLLPILKQRRKPRARWRTRVAKDGNLRWIRTTLQGRAPGFSAVPAPVGPWRPVRLVRADRGGFAGVSLSPSVDGDDGVVELHAAFRAGAGRSAASAEAVLTGPSGIHRAHLDLEGDEPLLLVHGGLRVPDVARWWPHTHGEPVLHDVAIAVTLDDGSVVRSPVHRTGFRALAPGAAPGHDVTVDGLDLHVNGVPVFARGAVWTSADPVGLAPTDDELRAQLELVRDAGMNLLRIAGIGVYESERFHELCDELGIMVWQDLALANMDYPVVDDDFRAALEAELAQLLGRMGTRPSTVVVCGDSEIEQQVAMLGLDPELARGPIPGELLPAALEAASSDAILVPSSPCGDPPIRPDVGITHYYGVGGYRRPLQDARRADVRFASESLAFANVPDDEALHDLLPGAPGDLVVHHPRWKAGVPRDAGAGWDFEDVRDHYLRDLYAVDPGELRRTDHERYLELSRTVTGEVMAATFGEWRRAASRCGGGLVLWWRDLVPGAGWGLVDHRGAPKVALHHLRRALAPVAVWTTDEGLGGIALHAANDTREPLPVVLRVQLFRDGEQPVASGDEELVLAPGATVERRVEELVGRFVDSAWAYRFGPAPHDLVVATLEEPGGHPLSQAVAFPAGRPLTRRSAASIGLTGTLGTDADGRPEVVLKTRALADGVRVSAPGWTPEDDAFAIAPGSSRRIALRPRSADAPPPTSVLVRALNVTDTLAVRPATPPGP